MTPEETNAAKIEAIASMLAVLLAKRMTEVTDRQLAELEEVMLHPYRPLAEAEVDPATEPHRRRRQIMAGTVEAILARARALAGR